VAGDRERTFVERALDEEASLWPDFLLQVTPSYERTATVDELAARGVLHAETARIFCTADGEPFHLYRHQVEALEQAGAGASYIVTSGGCSVAASPPSGRSQPARPAPLRAWDGGLRLPRAACNRPPSRPAPLSRVLTAPRRQI
jgi:hypothetical protein